MALSIEARPGEIDEALVARAAGERAGEDRAVGVEALLRRQHEVEDEHPVGAFDRRIELALIVLDTEGDGAAIGRGRLGTVAEQAEADGVVVCHSSPLG